MQTHDLSIRTIVDRQLAALLAGGINLRDARLGVARPMLAPGQDNSSEELAWLPIASTVSAAALDELEKRISYPLPTDYRAFLQYKHFYKLSLADALFCSHPVDNWQTQLEAMMTGEYPGGALIKKGYIPFADWQDWGYACFDARRASQDANYPVVVWDHEQPDSVTGEAPDFFFLLIQLDQRQRSWVRP